MGTDRSRRQAVRVFLSSASGALADYRATAVDVCHRLGMIPIHMEEFDPGRPPPLETCRKLVDSCDVFVLLLAHRHGSRPPGESHSYTELEYDWALARDGLPILPFVVDPDHPWKPADIDRGEDADALGRFVARVKRGHTAKSFGHRTQFREDLLLALRAYEPAADEEPEKASNTRLPAPPVFHAMPPYVGSAPFTGRSADLARLDDWAQSRDPMLIVEAIGGTGKSALTWEWASTRAPEVIDGLAGRLWWSFYDRSASMTRFLWEVLAYTTHRPYAEIRDQSRSDLIDAVLAELRARPFLLVLDGFERLLVAYHRFDPTKLRDDEVESHKRSMIDPQAEDVLRRFTAVGTSKVLLSTRLTPDALEGRFGQPMLGVRHLRLPGLTDRDTVELLDRLRVRGSGAVIRGFFEPLGNHPLLIGVMAGLVRDYRPDPGNFDRWLADPAAGGAMALADLDLAERRTHILTAALTGLPSASSLVLSWLSVLVGATDWTTLEAINPLRPPAPASVTTARNAERELAAWRSSEPVTQAKAQLDRTLTDLEDRGLLWWDRSSNSYDLHPIIRAYVHDRLDASDRVRANTAIRDHFQALPPEDLHQVTSVEDLQQTITIFRAVVGVGRMNDASVLWLSRLGGPLLYKLGAYSTIIELLAPLATSRLDPEGLYRSDLSIALRYQNRIDEAIRLDITSLADQMATAHVSNAEIFLTRLSEGMREGGSWLSADRLADMAAELVAASGKNPEVYLYYVLSEALLDARRGHVSEAFSLLQRAETMPVPTNYLPATGDIRCAWLELIQRAYGTVTSEQLNEAESKLDMPHHRMRLAGVRAETEIVRGDFDAAVAAAEQRERLSRNAGHDSVPGMQAFLLAKLGRTAEASAAVEETLARLPRIQPSIRPHYYLSRALRELGRPDEAVAHAVEAFHWAWHDGPPHHDHWALRDARALLEEWGVPVPELPVTDPTTVKVPLEDEIRAFIAKVRADHEARERGSR